METGFFEIDYKGCNANIAQIQVLAAVVRQMVRGEYNDEDSHLLSSLPLPKDYSNWNDLNNYCKTQKNAIFFRIINERFGSGSYICLYDDHSQPEANVYLQLSVLQNTFYQLENLKLETALGTDIQKLTQQLITSYIFLNHGIGDFFFNLACESETFDWEGKFYPGCINVDWMRELNGVGIFIANVENKERLQKVFKTRLGELACQCRFMAFWVCLLQIVTCPFISKAIQHSFTDFAVCLLCNFSSVYVHHIIVEQSALNQSVKSADRSSSDNITRLKIYFTLEDAHPMLVRFDLSHKGVPYLHINVEDENGEVTKFNHCRLSLTEVEDNILKPLEDALMTFNYNGIEFKHAPSDFDREMFYRMAVERALFGACAEEWGTVIFSDIYKEQGLGGYDWDQEHQGKLFSEAQEYLRESRTVLVNEVASYGFDPQELDHTEIFECVYDEMMKS